MKKLVLFVALFMASTMAVMADDDRPVAPSALPETIKTFVKEHFKGQEISYATKDWDGFEVYLSSAKLEFRADGSWKKVKTYEGTMPKSLFNLLPEPTRKYLNANYKNIAVRVIEKKRSSYEVELGNELDLEFNLDGTFRRIDD